MRALKHPLITLLPNLPRCIKYENIIFVFHPSPPSAPASSAVHANHWPEVNHAACHIPIQENSKPKWATGTVKASDSDLHHHHCISDNS